MEGVHVQCLTLLGFSHTCKRQRQLAPGFGTYVYCKLYGYQAFQEMKHNQRQSVPLTVKKCHQLRPDFALHQQIHKNWISNGLAGEAGRPDDEETLYNV